MARDTTYTTSMVVTSWDIGPNEKATPYLETNILTLTHVGNRKVAPRSPESLENRLEPRGEKGNSKGVWLYHPWSWSVICYECYTEKLNVYSNFECRSGPNNPISCGAMPVAIDGTSHTVTKHISNMLLSRTTTLFEQSPSTTSPENVETLATLPLEKRKSWHRRVTFDHPFIPGKKVCADAEWEKRGQSNAEVRLQKAGDDIEKCEKVEAQPIDLPGSVHKTVQNARTLSAFSELGTHAVYLFDSEADERNNVLAHKDL